MTTYIPSLSVPLSERYSQNPASVTPDEIIKALELLESLQDALESADLEHDESKPVIDFAAQIESRESKAISDNCPDYDAYKQFFEDCFEHLNGHYSCPSVTSDYDCSVIFTTIEKGEERGEEA